MGESDLDNIDRMDLNETSLPETGGRSYRRRVIPTQSDEILWRREIPETGENGNIISSGSVSGDQPAKKPGTNRFMLLALRWFEAVGQNEIDYY
jgi:hypothetical protein